MRHSPNPMWLVLVAGIVLSCRSSSAPTSYPHQPGSQLGPNQTLATDAAVRYVAIEGGCWALDTPQGSYTPMSLPLPYQVDGLRLYVVVRGDTGVVSICMTAPLVSVDSIRAL